MIRTGERLGAFRLKDHLGEDFDPMVVRDRCLLLSFHPLAWTPVCAAQMKALDENMAFFSSRGVLPVGISVDAHTAKKPWAEHLGLAHLRLLSDFWPHGALAQALGVFLEDKGFSGRANILVDRDKERTVVWTRQYDIPQVPDIEEVKAAVTAQCGGTCCCCR